MCCSFNLALNLNFIYSFFFLLRPYADSCSRSVFLFRLMIVRFKISFSFSFLNFVSTLLFVLCFHLCTISPYEYHREAIQFAHVIYIIEFCGSHSLLVIPQSDGWYHVVWTAFRFFSFLSLCWFIYFVGAFLKNANEYVGHEAWGMSLCLALFNNVTMTIFFLFILF